MEAREAKDEFEYQDALEELPFEWRHSYPELLCFIIQYMVTILDIRRGQEGIQHITKDFYEKREENGIKFILEDFLNVMEWSGGSCSFLLRTILLSYSFIFHVIWFILNNFSH